MSTLHKQFTYSKSFTFLLSSLFALAFGYILQYVFAIIPCKLCLYERIPYFIILLLSLLSLIKTHKITIYMIFLSYLVGAVISFYHMGLEFHWFSDVLGCTDQFDSLSIDEIRNNLLNPNRVASCDRAEFMLLGLSMAGWNFIYSIFWLVIGLLVWKRSTKISII